MVELHPAPGRIIYLNGASSAGKTSIASELQGVLEEPHLLLGIDTFIRMLPQRLFGSTDGWRFIAAGDGALRVEIGPRADRVFGAMYAAVAALSSGGNHVIFDDVMTSLQIAAPSGSMHGTAMMFCSSGALPRRGRRSARARTRRPRHRPGARIELARAHEHLEYDIEVDSSALSVAACANEICDLSSRRSRFEAFARLACTGAVSTRRTNDTRVSLRIVDSVARR